jgi:hypothetical protein
VLAGYAEATPEDAWLVPAVEPQKAPGYRRGVARLVAEQDLAGLLALLRHPVDPDLRAEAALALGELHNFEATELLVRALREDPESQVRSAAQQALTALFGSETNTVIASYAGSTAAEPWLVQPDEDEYDDAEDDTDDEDKEDQEPDENSASEPLELNLSDLELEGFIRVARHEGSHKLRLQAIRVLGHSPSQAAIDTLADLALWGDGSAVRLAARRALESLYGDAAGEILENYRAAQNETETEDDEDEEEDEYDEDEDLDEDEDEDEDDEEDDEDELDDKSAIRLPVASLPTSSRGGQFNNNLEPVTEEMGLPWRLLIGLVVFAGVGLLIFMLIGR